MSNTALSKKQAPQTIFSLVKQETVQSEFESLIEEEHERKHFLRVCLTCVRKIPKLLECDPMSLLACLFDLAAMNLEPDGRHAHLIPYGKECKIIVDYKGLLKMAFETKMVSSVHADIVYEGDTFMFNTGIVDTHVPWMCRRDTPPEKRGKILGAYVIIRFVNGGEKSEWMDKDEIEAIRKRSQAGNRGPWVTDWNEMAKKTVFRRASKWMPLHASVSKHIDNDWDSLAPQKMAGPSRRIQQSDLQHLFLPHGSAVEQDEFEEHEEPAPDSEPAPAKPPKAAAKKAPKPKPAAPELLPQETEEGFDWDEWSVRQRPIVIGIYENMKDAETPEQIDDVIAQVEKLQEGGHVTKPELVSLREFAASLA